MFLRRVASPIFVLTLPLALVLAGCSTLRSISILPSSGSVTLTATGQTAQFTAYGASTQGSTSSTDNITDSVTWASSNPSVATINSHGVATAVGPGKTQITASSDGLIATSDVTVTLSGSNGTSSNATITITPGSANDTFIGETTQFIATGTLTAGGASQNLTSQVTWASSNAQVATITAGGLATAMGTGSTTITASSGGTIASATLTVTTGTTTNATLAIIPTSATASFSGETTQFIALGNLSGGSATQDVTSNVTWSSSDVAVATIDKNGLATAVSANTIAETTTITAIGTTSTGSLITATATLTVQSGNGAITLPALSVYLSGSGSGTISSSTTSGGTTISCGTAGSGTSCTANFTRFAIVTLTATPAGTSKFGGWSSNCVPVIGNPLSCTIQMSNNETVGAVFNP